MQKSNPIWWEPKGLSAMQAAMHIGVSRSKFDEMVKDGRMPVPHTVDARRLWDRHEVEEAFDLLPRAGAAPVAPVEDPWEVSL
jgi:predicted DNA-binding transcriptional regulator AlpA